MTEQRRADDPRISQMVIDISDLQTEMKRNTETTEQVRDILTSFRMLAIAAKWIAAIGAGVAAIWHGVDFLRII